MKKQLPLLLFVLLAFAGCNTEPATFEPAKTPSQLCENAEKFAHEVANKSKHYDAEDWEEAISQFVQMGKNAIELSGKMLPDEQIRFNTARMKFVGAVDATGDESLSLHMKEEYGKIMGN